MKIKHRCCRTDVLFVIFIGMEIPECFYRVSAKALVLNETKDKFLIIKEDDGWWDIPGGGLDWGATPQVDIPREIAEEMSLEVTSISDTPSYFYVNSKSSKTNPERSIWYAYAVYETKLGNLDFKPSDECVEIKFVDKDNLPTEKVQKQALQLAAVFDPKKH